MTRACTLRRWLVAVVVAAAVLHVFAPSGTSNAQPCQMYAVGSNVTNPPVLYSANGLLDVTLNFYHSTDDNGNDLFCFVTPGGLYSPALSLSPGDVLQVTVYNTLPRNLTFVAPMNMTLHSLCDDAVEPGTAVNVHFHGTYTTAVCRSDDVLHTLIAPVSSYTYRVYYPFYHPVGLFWYHTHVHGLSEMTTQGGATGAIIIQTLENQNHAVANLPTQLLVLRDNLVVFDANDTSAPAWDISVNYIPIQYPYYIPATILMRPLERQLWRVGNTAADTIFNLTVYYDGILQPLYLVALDGVAVGTPNTLSGRTAVQVTSVLLGSGARAEFIVTAPNVTVQNATLFTENVDTGIEGDNDPARPIATILVNEAAPEPSLIMPAVSANATAQPCDTTFNNSIAATHLIYFSEVHEDPSDPESPTTFFVTADDQTPAAYDPSTPPAIIVLQGTTEVWTIQNRALEAHVWHIHQLHFLVIAQNGIAIPSNQQRCLDTFVIPGWDNNTAHAYPNITILTDFTGVGVGVSPFHCHILQHEDGGMMNTFQVVNVTNNAAALTMNTLMGAESNTFIFIHFVFVLLYAIVMAA